MSNIALKAAVYDRLGSVVGYADDGLFFPENDQPAQISHQESGVFEKEGGS